MSKTLTVLRQNVRTYLDEATTADWTDVEVDREINAAYHSVVTAVMTTYEEFYIKTITFNSTANQQEYTSVDGLPTDIFKLRRVELNYDVSDSNSIPRRAKPVSIDAVMRDLGNSALGLTVYRNPAYYYIGSGSGATGATLGFIPEPTKTGTNAIKIWYIPLIVDLSAASDEINIPYPDRYFTIIAKSAAGTLLRKGQQEEEVASRYLGEAKADLDTLQQEIEDRVSDDVKFIVDTSGEDVDFTSGGFY